MKLFQYAILLIPKADNKKQKACVLKDITNILAKDAQSATLLAARAIPEEYLSQLDEIQVAVRNF